MRSLAERARRSLWGVSGAFALVFAPFQCPSDPDPSQVREDSPGEALYLLSSEFAKANDKEAQVRTLQYIVDRYPRSRFADQARVDLKNLGVDVAPASVSADPNKEGVPMGRLPTDPGASATPSANASAPPAPSVSP